MRPYIWKSIQNWYFLHLKKSLKKSAKKFDKKKYFVIMTTVKFENAYWNVFDCKKLWTFFKRHIISSRFYNSEVAYVNRYDSQQTWLSFISPTFNSENQRCWMNDQHLWLSGLNVCKIRTFKEFGSFYSYAKIRWQKDEYLH